MTTKTTEPTKTVETAETAPATFKFEDAEYTPHARTGGGKRAEPNPFTDVIAAIALKVDPRTEKPQAKSFTFTHENTDDARNKAIARIKRQLSSAGADNVPPVTVYAPCTNVDDVTTRVTFWTIPKVTKGSPVVQPND